MTFIGQGKVHFQTAEWLGYGLIDFDYDVIGGKVVDGQQGVGHAMVSDGPGEKLLTFDE